MVRFAAVAVACFVAAATVKTWAAGPSPVTVHVAHEVADYAAWAAAFEAAAAIRREAGELSHRVHHTPDMPTHVAVTFTFENTARAGDWITSASLARGMKAAGAVGNVTVLVGDRRFELAL